MFTEDVSEETTNSFDTGQLLTAPQSKSAEVLPSEQYSSDLDTDQRIMAQSYRMSVYTCKGIRYSWHQL